jgi:hypothetical protein
MQQLTKLLFLINHPVRNCLIAIAFAVMVASCGGGDQQIAAEGAFPIYALAGARQSAPQKNSSPTFGPRANYTITKTSTGYTVTDFVGGTGTQSVNLASKQILFSDMTVNLGIGDKSKTISAANLQSLIELYIAYFNRVPDADGLSYWIDQLESGKSLDQIGTSFYNAAIYYSSLTGYSASMTNAEFITVIYKNVLGRSSVDSGGMTYWSNGLANGSVTRGTLVGSILASAHTFKGDTTYGYVADLLDNKVEFAKFFTIQLGLNYNTPEDSIKNTMAMVAAVTPTSTAGAVSMLSPISSQVSISTTIKTVVYPTAYNTTAKSPVIDDTCLHTSTSISYPESYKGEFQLPQVNGSFAKTNVALSITPKDDWVNSVIGGSNPNMNNGCLTTHKQAFTSTLVRLKALGTKYLTIMSSTRLDDATNPTKLTGYFISDDDLLWMGQQAAENGMKLRFTMLIDVWDIKGNNLYVALNKLNTSEQLAWGIKFLRLYNEMMIYEASVMATMPNNFDAIKLDWGYFDPAIFNDNKAIKIASMVELSQAIRKIHNWKQWIGNFTVTNYSIQPSHLNPGSDLLINSVDLIEMMPQKARAMTQQEENNLSAEFVKNFFNIVPNWLITTKKPIIWHIQVQSHRTFFSKGWIEDCCITSSYTGAVADFSVQAIGIEGMLEMISEKNSNGDVITESVNFTSYWWTDTIKPYQSLPEISQSIRNKPAESIVYQWWKQ